jgi:integrase
MDTPAKKTRAKRLPTFTDEQIAALKPKAKAYVKRDPLQPGHYVRVQPSGTKHFYVIKRVAGKLKWVQLDATTDLSVAASREKAKAVLTRLRQGLAPFEPPPPKVDSVAEVTANWFKRHVEKNGVRTADEIRRILDRYILPIWAEREFASLKRSDIAALLDRIEDRHSAAVADSALTVLRSVATWHAARDDGYTPPFVKGMRRVSRHKQRRERILDDSELRRVWRAAESGGTFGAFVRVALLTAQRREGLVGMRWADVTADGVWHIPAEERAKGTGGDLKLPEAALQIIRAQPRLAGNPYIFAGNRGPIGGMAKRKARLDAQSGVSGFTVHDCRRTARSLMSRAGVLSEHAERVLGHARNGVEGIYDRHKYEPEKAAALAKLAALIERIVNPPNDEIVVPLHREAVPT